MIVPPWIKLLAVLLGLGAVLGLALKLYTLGVELGTLRVTNEMLHAELANRENCLAKITAYRADLADYQVRLAKAEYASA